MEFEGYCDPLKP